MLDAFEDCGKCLHALAEVWRYHDLWHAGFEALEHENCEVPEQIDIQILCKALRLHYLEHRLAICVKGCHGHFGQDWRVFAHLEYHVGHRLQATAVLMVVLEADEQILRKIFKELLLLDVLAFYDDVYLRTY